MIHFVKTHLIARILIVVLAIILLIAAGSIAIQLTQTRSAVEEAVGSYNMRIAESYAKQMDTARYAEFLKNPQETELYWSLRQELDRFRTDIGALYVYFVRLDENGKPLLMIDGQPRESTDASPIGEETDMPEQAAQQVLAGRNATTPLIENPDYGTYISAYAPVRDAAGSFVGAIGIDTDAEVLKNLTDSVISQSIPFYLLMLLVTIGAAGFVAWVVVRALRPLRTITASAGRMAAGDLAEARAMLLSEPVRSGDEIGTAYNAMVQMSEHLNEMVSGMVAQVASASDQLAISSQEFARHAEQMLQMSESVDGSVRHIHEGAARQTQSSDESARAVEEIATGIGRISESSSTVSEAAVQALQVAEAGQSAVNRMHEQIGYISSTAAMTVEIAGRLQGYSSQMEDVLRSIHEFADQTKLLALNASIEAARAGEHGSGFTVVAQEVRKLADASSEAVQGVASLLDNIGRETAKISEQMNGATREIGEGVRLSADAEQSFMHTVTAFKLVTEQIMEVSATVEQLSAGSEEVAASVGSIAEIAHGVARQTRHIREMTDGQLGMIKQVAAASSELNGSLLNMRQAIRQVKV
ncbi:methyl-accepting chemotaxis protein [Paenibacillus sp. UNCCL117]|uniref:methyl-accepting chemotaxis protein n=1 Tax=unclassified Paenibacillus TaxID=185978 RepID=UPI00088F1409|nr:MULTISPECIES: HAMP domain-containing methyl-accepting chemotaxis protein [unclassified Paenibacillus]SDD13157.1 methyl-accepting chemotaxis protein [Paenibacillus sp. cl123]SFW33931.1 methyl-accepting chemotaxis protein [Paenibacillus sp. UNCCL117]